MRIAGIAQVFIVIGADVLEHCGRRRDSPSQRLRFSAPAPRGGHCATLTNLAAQFALLAERHHEITSAVSSQATGRSARRVHQCSHITRFSVNTIRPVTPTAFAINT